MNIDWKELGLGMAVVILGLIAYYQLIAPAIAGSSISKPTASATASAEPVV